MQLNISYKILKNKKLIIQHFSGEVFYEDIVSFFSLLKNDPEFDSNYNMLIDMRKGYFMFTEDHIMTLFDHIEKTYSPIKRRRVALLTKTSNQVVIAMLFEKYMLKPLQSHIFSTLDGTINFLGFSENDLFIVNEHLNEVSKEFILKY